MASFDVVFPTKAQLDSLNANLESIKNAILIGKTITNWQEVASKVRGGQGATYFPVGSQLLVPHATFGDMLYDVVAHDYLHAASGQSGHTMTICAHDQLGSAVQFDAPEALYYAASALAAGTYNFTLTSQPWYSSDAGITFQFTLTQTVPAGGVICLNMTYNEALAGKTASTYSTRSATTAIETVTISQGSAGTSLGATDDALNHIHRICFGSNNWKESAMRQFLNSAQPAGQYWTPQTKFDRPPSWNDSLAGFMSGFDEDFLSVIGPVTLPCSANNTYESPDSTTTKNTAYTVTDKFYLPSRCEAFNSHDVADASVLYPYYASAVAADRIKYRNGSATYWWLRTPNSGNAGYVRRVDSDGSLNNASAYGSSGVVPACTIS